MKRYSIEELGLPETYAQDAELALLVRQLAKKLPTPDAYSGLKDPWKGFRDAMLQGRHPEVIEAHFGAADTEIFKAAQILTGDIAMPEDWTWKIQGQQIILSGRFVEGMAARLRRIGGDWDPTAKTWTVPAAKAASLRRVFGNAAKGQAPAAPVPTLPASIEELVRRVEARAQHGGVPLGPVIAELKKLDAEAYPEARRRVAAAVDSDHRRQVADAAERKAAAERQAAREAAWAKEQSQQQSQSPQKRQQRMLYPLSEAPAMNRPMRLGSHVVVVTGRGEAFRIGEDHPSMHGPHLLGHEGSRGAYHYWREATSAEVAELEQAEAAATAKRAAQQARDAEIRAIREQIQTQGERPEGWHEPAGEVLLGGPDLYGGGEWMVLGPEWIWYVRNNGMDGDAWGNNNVRTGGAGAIGWRLPWSAEVEQRIRALTEAKR